MHIAFDVLADAIKDTLYIIPFLFVTYLAMEWLEHKTVGRPRLPFSAPARQGRSSVPSLA